MKNYAILIGSSRFEKEPKLTPLRCPENDVDGMCDVLTSPEFGLFSVDNLLTFKNRNHHEILPEINAVFKKAEPQDLILLYYSGHGELDNKDRLHLTTLDSQKEIIETTSIPTERLRRLIDNHRCKRVVLILDCCFSGSVQNDFLNRSNANSEITKLSKGIYILTASTASQKAEEKEGDKYGLLTKHILEGIQTGQAETNQDGLISVDAIYQYVSREVPKSGAQDPMRYDLQVQGDALLIARSVNLFSSDRLRVFKETVLKIEDEIDDDVYWQALRVIKENQLKRDKKYFDLLNDLCTGQLKPGKFSGKWMKLEKNAAPDLVSLFEAALEPESLPAPTKAELKLELPKSITEYLNSVPLEMILVPEGKFIMGGLPAGKFMMGGATYDDEKPQHEVVVPRFYIGKYQVTQKQWQVVMGKNPSRFKSEGLPVENISWNDAKEFCKKLSEITKREYRLPSEAEWEYACRAGTTGDYAGKLADMAWYAKNLGDNAHPVGKKKPNAFGLYDMHGNVWEWCEDVWHENYLDAPQDGSAWIEGGNNDRRVARGGSWNGNAHSCRSAFRINFDPVGCGGNLGLRIVASTRTL